MTTLAQAYEYGYGDGQHVAGEESAARIEDLGREVARLADERDRLADLVSTMSTVQDALVAESRWMRGALDAICAHNYCDEDCPLYVSESEPCRMAGVQGGDGE
jgi:hypothetical protein